MELQRFTRLGRVTRDLSAATDLDAVTDIVTRLAGEAVGASVTMLALRAGDDLVTLGLRGMPLLPELAEGRFPLATRIPIRSTSLWQPGEYFRRNRTNSTATRRSSSCCRSCLCHQMTRRRC